ncbi:MAG: uracil-DNA glycosylase [Alphaproteobacteria bacterium]
MTKEILLRWYHDQGIDLILKEQTQNRFILKAVTTKMISKNFDTPVSSIKTLDELKQALKFCECSLKHTALNTVFGDGNIKSSIMFVGEAPGADEDRIGRPFVGQSGQLLDRILKAINLDRSKIYISNIIPWRPPGNRTPTTQEISLCQTFIERHIELIAPKILILLGGVAAKALLKTTEGIMKLRGVWKMYKTANNETEIPTLATFHPAYLLRSPTQKALIWQDFLAIEEKLNTL